MARKAAKASGEQEDLKPEYIMMVGGLINGITLSGFGDGQGEAAKVFPGEKIKVRGEDGINFDLALKMIQSGRFIWCDENGTPKPDDYMPTVSKEEDAIIKATGAAEISRQGYPDFHREDRGYTGPAESLPVDIPEDTAADFQPVPVALPVVASSGRRDTIEPAGTHVENIVGGDTQDSDED